MIQFLHFLEDYSAQIAIGSLVAFAIWAVVLSLVLVTRRSLAMGAKGQREITSFKPIGDPDAGLDRMSRAHMNTLENLPIFGALVFALVTLEFTNHAIAILCILIVKARIIQSLIHIFSGSPRAITFRFVFFLIQALSFLGLGGFVCYALCLHP